MMSRQAGALKVLEVNKFYLPHVGGIERVVQELAEGFTCQGHHVRVLTCQPHRGPRRIRRQGHVLVVEAASFGTFMSMPISLDFLFLFLCLRRWADVVHWHEPFPLATIASVLIPRHGFAVVTWHSDIVRQRLLKSLFGVLQRFALRRADLIVPTSEPLARFSAVVDEASPKTQPIPIGLALENVTRIPSAAEERWLRERRPYSRYALFVGRLVYYKGVDVLLAAAARSPVFLVLVGQGPLEQWVIREIDRLCLHERVRLIHRPVDDDELAFFYKHCAFLVLPSTATSEAFGIVQVEAMAFGKPVVNTSLPTGVPTVSLHRSTGLTVAPNDVAALSNAMAELWSDPGLCMRLGEAAHHRAWGEFHRDAMVARYSSAIRARLARRASTPARGVIDDRPAIMT
jgi:rhamnosyl/mannosyltransferase